MIKDIFKKINIYMDGFLLNCQEQFMDMKNLSEMISKSEAICLTDEKGKKYPVFGSLEFAGLQNKSFLDCLKNTMARKKGQEILDSILKDLDREMHRLDTVSKELKEIKEHMTLSGFCKPPFSLFPFFGYISTMAEAIPLTIEEMAQLFGYSIYFKGNYYQRNPKSLQRMAEKDIYEKEEISFCIKLASYFDKEGHVLPLEDATLLKETLNSFYTYGFPDFEKDETIVTLKSYMEKLKEYILNNLEVGYQNEEINPGKTSEIHIHSPKNKGQNILLRELATYYQEGEIIASCDLNHFRDLLLALEFSTAEVELIYHKMEKFLVQENEEQIEKYPFSEEEKNLLRRARANSYKENIKRILEDIDAALALFNENPSCLEDIKSIVDGDLEILGYALPKNYEETIKKNFVN